MLSLSPGLGQYGEPIHASMYNDLWINNPYCSNEYPDYTYEEHFGKNLPAYVPRVVVRDYLEGLTRILFLILMFYPQVSCLLMNVVTL